MTEENKEPQAPEENPAKEAAVPEASTEAVAEASSDTDAPAKPAEGGSKPSKDSTKPSKDSTKPGEGGTELSEDGTESNEEEAPKRRAKTGRIVPSGIAYVNATFNNTKVTFTDLHGNTLCWASAGRAGFKGSRKSTAYAAQLVASEATKKAQILGMKEVEIRIKGPGAGRESAVRGIAAAGMEITSLRDVTPVPHNGCRPPKRRRV